MFNFPASAILPCRAGILSSGSVGYSCHEKGLDRCDLALPFANRRNYSHNRTYSQTHKNLLSSSRVITKPRLRYHRHHIHIHSPESFTVRDRGADNLRSGSAEYSCHWLPVFFRIEFKIMLIAYKVLHDRAPIYTRTPWIGHFRVPLCLCFKASLSAKSFLVKMSSACSFIFMQIKVIFLRKVSHLDSLWNRDTRELGNGLLYTASHILRSSNRNLLVKLYFNLNSYGKRTFSVASLGLWNSSPEEIKSANSIDDCKRNLKTFLF